jgi:hypothetical protein
MMRLAAASSVLALALADGSPGRGRLNAEATAYAAAVNTCVDDLADAVHACIRPNVRTTAARDAALVQCMGPVVDKHYDALGFQGCIVCVTFMMLPLDKEPTNDNKWLVHAEVINWYAWFQALICPNLEGDDKAEGVTVQGSLSFGCDGRNGFQNGVAQRFKDDAVSDPIGPATKKGSLLPSTTFVWGCNALAGESF